MPMQKLKEFLDSHQIKYVTISHSKAYTAQEVAATSHVPGKELAKTVIIKIDGKMAMAVLPSSFQVDFYLLKKAMGANIIDLAEEGEFKDTFPGCDVGAMPPFGNLYGMAVYVDNTLSEDKEIAFNAGTHTELIRLAYKDFEQLVQPTLLSFATR
ncbi:MAG: YbaK/EbsC family protein [Candidatus Latescibacteria bacterium]|nr:YbaK/EbsC family protein [Candidatus Latescibacterota bacterium]